MSVGERLERWPCPCCGHRTLAAPTPSWATCPVCFWTDEDCVDPALLDQLFHAQRAFQHFGASAERWRAAVRAPVGDEAPPAAWQPLPEPSARQVERAALVGAIRAAFADVDDRGRPGLTETFRLDYHSEPDVAWDDQDRGWAQIPGEVLDYFGTGTTVFTFGNLAGYRYYLPAFMLRSLATEVVLTAARVVDLPLRADQDPTELPEVQSLTAPQRAAVAGFVRYVVRYHRPAVWAERALARIWAPVTGISAQAW